MAISTKKPQYTTSGQQIQEAQTAGTWDTEQAYPGGHTQPFQGANASITRLNLQNKLAGGTSATGNVTGTRSTLSSGSRTLQPKSPIGQTTVSTTKYAGQAPGAAPVYKSPERWSESRRAGEIQQNAAVGIKENRRSLREAIANLGNDPQSRLALRDALEAHGINTERTLLGAKTSAQNAETQDLNFRAQQASAEFQSAQAAFQAEWQKYLSTATTTTTSKNVYSSSEADELTGTGSGQKYKPHLGWF